MNMRWHKVVGGDPAAAVKYGLTLKAACGEVWTPVILSNPEDRPEVPHCLDCYPAIPHYVYRCFNSRDELIYVGCTGSLSQRGQAHRKNTWWWPQVERTRLIVFPNREAGLLAESAAIFTEAPFWNVRGQKWSALSELDLHRRLSVARATGAPESVIKRFERTAAKNFGLNWAASA